MFELVSQSKFVDREIKAHESNDVCEEVRRSSQTSSSIKERAPGDSSHPGRKVSASSADSLHEERRRTVRRVFAFRECEEKVPGKFASFHPRAGRRPRRHHRRRLRRIDSSKGNSYPLTGRNSLRGEILNRAQRTQRGLSTSKTRRAG